MVLHLRLKLTLLVSLIFHRLLVLLHVVAEGRNSFVGFVLVFHD